MIARFTRRESPRPLALMRVVLCGTLLCAAAVRWPYVVELYSTDGAVQPLFPGDASLHPPELSAGWTVALYAAMLFALFTAAVGWQTRLSLWAAVALTAWFGLLDAAGTFKKFSVISLHLMLLLSFSGCHYVCSLDRLCDGQRRARGRLSPAWPRWLMQVLLANIYWQAAVTKLRMTDFATGDLLVFALLDDAWGGGRFGHWIAIHPSLAAAIGVTVIAIEILLPVLLCLDRTRRWGLALAAAFHIGMGATMFLSIFTPVMLAALFAFVREDDLKWVDGLQRRYVPHPSFAAPVVAAQRSWFRAAVPPLAWCAVAALVAATGWLEQHSADRYGVFGGNPPQENWRLLDEADVEEMLAAQKPPYPAFFHRVEIGSRFGHRQRRTFGERDRFRRGMSVCCLARLVPRNEHLRIEWAFYAPNGDKVASHSHQLSPPEVHSAAEFVLIPESPPGRYVIVLHAEGHEITRRQFELVVD